MRLTKRFMLGVFVATGAGLLVSLIPYQAGLARSESTESFAIDVPLGRFGDDILFSGYWSEGGIEGGRPWADEGRYDRRFKLEGPVRAMDRVGAEMDAARWISGELSYGGSTGKSTSNTTTYYLDLETRQPIRRDFNGEWEDRASGFSYFGPGFGTAFANLLDVRFQGTTLRLGENISHSQWGGGGEPSGYPYNYRRLHGQSWEDVPARATVNGTPTIIFQERWLELGVVESSDVMTEYTGKHSLYFSADSPYPLLAEYIEDVVFTAPNGTTEHSYYYRDRTWLRQSLSGNEPVPWGQENNAAPPSNSERVIGSNQPLTDGDGSKLAFPLADAIALLATDPQASEFRAWARAREVRLVGAVYHTSYPAWVQPAGGPLGFRTGTLVDAWHLYFADAKANVVFVRVDQHDSVRIVRQDATPVALPSSVSLSFDDLPENPLTIGAARSILDSLVDAKDKDVPTRLVRWGVAHALAVPGAGLSPSASSATPHMQLLQVTIHESRLDSTTIPASNLPQAHAGLRVNIESGERLNFWSWREFPTLGLPQAPVGREPAATSIFFSSSAPVVDPYPAAALVASTFLAAFLAVYFYPLLKFLGAQAAVGFPGYAKLRRSELLTHTLRDAIVQHVRTDPGITPPQLQANTGAAWSTIVYHLSVLEKNKVLSSLIDGRHKRFFPVDTMDWSKRDRIAALKNTRTKELYSVILDEPGVVRGALADRTGVSIPAVTWHLERLERAGLVAHDAIRRKFRYYAVEAVPAPRAYDAHEAVEVS